MKKFVVRVGFSDGGFQLIRLKNQKEVDAILDAIYLGNNINGVNYVIRTVWVRSVSLLEGERGESPKKSSLVPIFVQL